MQARFFTGAVVVFALLLGCSDPEPVNQTHQGRLEEGDAVLEQDNSRYDEYSFTAKEGWNIAVAMNSSDFDSYLHLIGPDGNTIAQNDDVQAGNLNSQIATVAPASGEYKVIANSRSQGEEGAYTVTISAQPGQ